MALPYRLTERSYKRFERYIFAALNQWPMPLVCDNDIPGLSGASFAARLRDALLGLKRYHWNLTLTLDERINDLKVFEQDGKVILGRQKDVPPEAKFKVEALDLRDLSNPLQKQTLCLLAAARALSKPILITSTPDEVSQLEMSWDVSITKQPDGTYLLE